MINAIFDESRRWFRFENFWKSCANVDRRFNRHVHLASAQPKHFSLIKNLRDIYRAHTYKYSAQGTVIFSALPLTRQIHVILAFFKLTYIFEFPMQIHLRVLSAALRSHELRTIHGSACVSLCAKLEWVTLQNRFYVWRCPHNLFCVLSKTFDDDLWTNMIQKVHCNTRNLRASFKISLAKLKLTIRKKLLHCNV
jgi:hypothetical protein